MTPTIRFRVLFGVAGITAVKSLSADVCDATDEAMISQQAPLVAAALAPGAPPLTAIAHVRRGEAVSVRGEVMGIRDEDEFVLRDDTGRIRIYIGWQNDLPVEVGDLVTVEGRADDDAISGMRPEIYARALVLSSGQRIELH